MPPMVFQWFFILLPSLPMVFDGSGPLVKRCDGFDGSLWSKPLSQRPLIGNGRDEDFADVCHTSVHLISVMLKLKSGSCAITAAHQIIHNGGRTHGRRRPSLRIANGGGGPELTSSTVLLTSNQQHTRLLTKSAAINKVLLMNQLPTSSPRAELINKNHSFLAA